MVNHYGRAIVLVIYLMFGYKSKYTVWTGVKPVVRNFYLKSSIFSIIIFLQVLEQLVCSKQKLTRHFLTAPIGTTSRYR